jgi:putative transposase
MRDYYKGYRLPKSVISFAVPYYYRYKIRLKELSEMLQDRDLSVADETI